MHSTTMKLYGPLKFALAWFVFVFLLFILGPVKWVIHNEFLFIVLLLSYHVAFIIGYDTAIKKSPIRNISITESKLLKFLPFLIYLNLLFTIIAAFRYAKIPSISFSALFERVLFGIAFSGDAYKEAHKLDATVGGDLFPSIHCLFSPFLISVYPLSLYYLKKLKKHLIVIVFITLLFEMARWFAVGTNKGVFDIVFYTAAIIFLKYLQTGGRIKLTRSTLVTIVLGLCIVYGAISMFGKNIASRTGETQESNLYGTSFGGDLRYRPNSVFTFWANEQFKVTMFSVDDYLTQGYYSFSRAISEPFTTTYGVGHSVFLMENVNPRLMDRTYQAKLEKYGIDRWVNWHSCYLWWANDVSFVGVIFVMFLFGYYFGAVYKDIRYTRNPVAIVIFCLLMIWLFYSSANNQIMSFPFQATAFMVLTAYWIISRHTKITI